MAVDDGGETGRDDNPLYCWSVLGDGVQDSSCAIDGGLVEVLYDVLATSRSRNWFSIAKQGESKTHMLKTNGELVCITASN